MVNSILLPFSLLRFALPLILVASSASAKGFLGTISSSATIPESIHSGNGWFGGVSLNGKVYGIPANAGMNIILFFRGA